MSRPDVLVVGGGAIGCAVALACARKGASVTVLESHRIASGTSYGSGGMLAPQVEAHSPGALLTLGLQSRDMFPAWCSALEESCGLDTAGILRVASSESTATALQQRAAWQRDLGLRAELCDPQICANMAPGLGPVLLGLWVPDAQVDAPRFTLAMSQAAIRQGVEICEGTTVRRVLDGAVETSHGRQEAGAIVLAAGAWSGLLTDIPVGPLKGQRLMLRHTGPQLPQVLWTDRCYLVPKSGGRVLVGATEEPAAGFDRRVTVGAIAQLATATLASLPSLAGAELQEVWAGLRPTTPDHLPLLGALPGYRRAFVATGHHRNGILLAPLTGQLMAEAILEGAPLPAACAPDRFAPPPCG